MSIHIYLYQYTHSKPNPNIIAKPSGLGFDDVSLRQGEWHRRKMLFSGSQAELAIGVASRALMKTRRKKGKQRKHLMKSETLCE